MKKNYLKVFLICMTIALSIILPNIIKNNGKFVLPGDFAEEQVAFNININNELKNGNNLYSFNSDLGSSIIESYGFYNLTSPFTLIGTLFLPNLFPYLVGILLIIKFGLTGLFAYIYLKTIVKKDKLCLLGAILYSFSGFQICNLFFYHFYESVMIFPLIILSIDNLFFGKKKNYFGLILGLSIFMNYFFAFGQMVFILIYIIINMICKRYKLDIKNFIRFLIELLLGVGISFIVLYPTMASVFNNPRVGASLSISEYFAYPITRYIKIIQSLLFGSDAVMHTSISHMNNWSSCEIYLPLLGLVPSLMYIFKNKKDYLCILIYTLFIFMFIPILNSSFTLFNIEYYSRWFYMFSFILVIASVKALDKKLEIRNGYACLRVIWLIYIMLVIYYGMYIVKSWHILDSYYLIIFLIGFISFILVKFLIKKYYRKDNELYLIIPTIFITLIMGFSYLYITDSRPNVIYNILSKDINKNIINDNSEFYRVNYYGCNSNTGNFFNLPSTDSFNSTLSPSIFEFYKGLGINRKQNSSIDYFDEKLIDFFSVKYIVSCNNTKLLDEHYKLINKIDKYNIYINSDYQKMGIVLNDYMSESDYNDIVQYKDKKDAILTKYIGDDRIIYNDSKIINSNTYKIKNGLHSKIEISKDTTILYTIPYDEDFDITVNNQKQEILKLDKGLIGFNIKKGINDIKIIYSGRRYYKGLTISIISTICYILYYLIHGKQ